jgi:hypothetical protein
MEEHRDAGTAAESSEVAAGVRIWERGGGAGRWEGAGLLEEVRRRSEIRRETARRRSESNCPAGGAGGADAYRWRRCSGDSGGP